MVGRLDEPNGSKRICYSCGHSYPDFVRFCPRDSSDLEFLPQSVESISNDFKRPRRWAAISLISALLLIIAGLIVQILNPAPSDDSSARGELTVKTTPAGARVYLDGSQVGISPVRLSAVPTGVHEVRAVFPGYSVGKAHVEILPSETQKLVWDLSPLPERNKVKDKKKFMAHLYPKALPSAPVPSNFEESI